MGEVAAKEYYEAAMYGDPVEVTGSSQDMSEKDALYDWKYTPDEWQALSRLSS